MSWSKVSKSKLEKKNFGEEKTKFFENDQSLSTYKPCFYFQDLVHTVLYYIYNILHIYVLKLICIETL